MNTFRKYHILLFSALSISHVSKAFSWTDTTDGPRKLYAAASARQGSLVERQNFVLKDYYVGMDVKLGWQTDDRDRNIFDVSYRYPRYGVGYYMGNMNGIILGDDSISAGLGKPAALYAYFGAPVYRDKWFSVGYNISAGFSYNFNSYNPEHSPSNILIGYKNNAYLEFSFEASLLLPGYSTLSAGISFQHFSNGSYQKPNKGINLISGTIAYQWNLYKNKDKRYTPIALPEWTKSFEWDVFIGSGVRMLDTGFDKKRPREGKRWTCLTFSTAALRQVSHRRKWGAGIELFYYEWGSYVDSYHSAYKELIKDMGLRNPGVVSPSSSEVQRVMKSNAKFSSDNFTVGIYAAHEVGYKRLWLITDLGIYPFPRVGDQPSSPIIYERLGARVELTDRLFVGVAIKAHGFKADFTEWSVGYALMKKKPMSMI
ncbi:MAG: acyloxyacyl hydrolase [Prevotellaceae bacterium]|jgi:hypothetical protein|nr:acyloxyacyl hydrolase [Prevotellaceae bacterium]